MIKNELRQIYFNLIIPLPVIIALIYIGQVTGILSQGGFQSSRIVSVTVLVLVSAFSLGMPVLYRTIFVTKIKNRKSITIKEFLKFEKNLLLIVLVSPYFTIIALLINLPKFFFVAVILIAIYAVYYYYPSDKRIKFEKKLFRITE
jgi:hypothetical protein